MHCCAECCLFVTVCVRFLPFSVLVSLVVGVQDVSVRRLRELAAEEEERKAREEAAAAARERGLEVRNARSAAAARPG